MRSVALALTLLVAPPAFAALPANTAVALYSLGGGTATGEIPEGAPPRFVLLEDGQVFVGGVSRVASARIPGRDLKAIGAQLDRVRKLGNLASPVTIGPGAQRFRLLQRKGQPELIAQGDPSRAAGAAKPLGALIETLLAFDHPALRVITPESFLLSLQPGVLPGGCREWRLPVKPAQLRRAPAVVTASVVVGWPTGGHPALVCDGDEKYTVTLRPLLPGETP
jgi:hypothetical protein